MTKKNILKKSIKTSGILLYSTVILLASGCSREVKDKELTMTFNGKDIQGMYTGLYVDKSFTDDEATFNYKDGDSYLDYKGGFKEGKFEGKGHLESNFYTIHFGDVVRVGEYKGDSIDGIANGKGEFKATNDAGYTYTYTGEFLYGTFNGYGERVWDSEFATETGNYTNGDFDPTILEAITYQGSNNRHLDDKEEIIFSPTEKAIEFINNNPTLFENATLENVTPFVNPDIKFKNITKSPYNFGDQIIKYDGTVAGINEFSIGNQVWTRVQIQSSQTVFYDEEDIDYTFYYTFYKGKLDDIYDNDKITVYGLPIDITSFTNVSNTTTQAVVLLDAYVVKR